MEELEVKQARALALARARLRLSQQSPQADMSFMGRLKDNVIGVEDGVMSPGEKLGTLMGMGLEGLTLGLAGDEFRARADAAIGDGEYEANLDRYRANEDAMRQQHPVTSFAAEVLPALTSPVAVARKAPTLGKQFLAGSATAGAGGGLFGFLEGEGGAQNRAQNAAITGGLSAALGGAGPIAARKLTQITDKRKLNKAIKNAAKVAPDNDEIAARSSQLYNDLRAIPVAPDSLANQLPNIRGKAKGAGFRDTTAGRKLTSRSSSLIDEIGNTAEEGVSSIADFHDLRKLTNAATGNISNPLDQTVGKTIRDGIDDAINEVSSTAGGKLAEANKLWSILKKNEQMDEIFAKAANQASGFENGLRIQFRQILNSKKKRAGYTKAELAAMEEVIQGSAVGNLMKKIGKLGFGRGQQSNVLSGTAGTMVFGPMATVAGQGALAASESATARKAKAVQDLIRIGGNPQLQLGNNPTVNLLEALNRSAAPRVIEALR